MSPHPARNVVASVHQRLLNLAQQRGENFQEVLRRYGLERLLYRVSCLDQGGQLILKGAHVFSLWDETPHRATRDLDFLGSGESDVARFEQFFRDLCLLEVEADGLTFVPESVVARQMREGEEYEGVRVELMAKLGSARIPLQIDIGFGDVVTPAPLEVEFPTLLPLPAPRLRAYPRETVVAEKFCIMVQLGMANSRLKDYYDLWVLSQHFSFEGPLLCQAMRATFARRKTLLPQEAPPALTSAFSENPLKQRQWTSFLAKGRLVKESLSLADVVPVLRDFLMPPAAALVADVPFAQFWPAGGPWRLAENEKVEKIQV
jgi:predicted nucleotidyltransferase component of viral defense system